MPRLVLLSAVTAVAVAGAAIVIAGRGNHATGPADYYVDAALGDDAAAGTAPHRAWRTLRRASDASMAPGSRVLLRRGSEWRDDSLSIEESGRTDAPIVVTAYGTGALPRIVGGRCVELTGDHTVLSDVHVDSCDFAGVHLAGSGQVVRRILATSNVVGVFASPASTDAVIVENVLRENDRMSVNTRTPATDDSGAFGVALAGVGAEVARNQISGSVARSFDFGSDGAAVEVFGARGSRVHHNVATANLAFAELGKTGADDNRFSFNVVASDIPGSTFLVTRGRGRPFGPVTRTVAEHNTVVLTGAGSVGFTCGGCEPEILRLRSNIFDVAGTVGQVDGELDDSHNLYWGSALGFRPGPHTIRSAPEFVDRAAGDYRLRPSSPGVDAGAQLGGAPDRDAVDVPHDGDGDGLAAPDVGAYELQPDAIGTALDPYPRRRAGAAVSA